MSQNLYGSLETRNASLTDKLTRNADLTKTFSALVSNLVTLCNRRGSGIESVRIGAVTINDRKLKAPITFGKGGSEKPWTARQEFYDYTKQKASRLARAIERNPELVNFLGRMIASVESYCEQKCIPFARLRIGNTIIDRGNTLVMELTK